MKQLKLLLNFLLWSFGTIIGIPLVIATVGHHLRKYYLSQAVDEEQENAVAVMEASHGHVTSSAFKGGYVRAVMGGVSLDLRDTVIVEKPATIYATVVCGGVAINVPPEWKVETHSEVVFGGTHNESRPGDCPQEKPVDLVITGKIILGKIVIT